MQPLNHQSPASRCNVHGGCLGWPIGQSEGSDHRHHRFAAAEFSPNANRVISWGLEALLPKLSGFFSPGVGNRLPEGFNKPQHPGGILLSQTLASFSHRGLQRWTPFALFRTTALLRRVLPYSTAAIPRVRTDQQLSAARCPDRRLPTGVGWARKPTNSNIFQQFVR